MDAWIALGFVAAWLGAEPGLNQPRPQAAQPLPSVVVPAVVEAAFIPPAPLPELGILQIHFELAAPESCQDSRVHPPAPPAELDTVDLGGLLLESNNRVIRTGAFEIHLVGADDAEESAVCPDPIPFQFLPESDVIFRKGTPLPAQLFSSELPPMPQPEVSLKFEPETSHRMTNLGGIKLPKGALQFETLPLPYPPGTIKVQLGEPQAQFFLSARLEAREAAAEDGCSSPVAINPSVNKDVVQHLQAAIQHLEATGTYLEEADLKRALDMLRLGREQAVEKLLRQQRQELEAKEAELQRLKYEVEQLKKDLMSAAGGKTNDVSEQETAAQRPGSPDGRVRLTDATEELAPSPLGVQPLSNDQPAPAPEPVQQLINPSFYVNPPQYVKEAWRKAFTPTSPESPKIRLLPMTQYYGPSSPIVPASSEDDSTAVRLPPSPRPVPFQLVPSPPVAGGTLILIPVPTPTPSLVPDLGEPTSEPPSDDGPSA